MENIMDYSQDYESKQNTLADLQAKKKNPGVHSNLIGWCTMITLMLIVTMLIENYIRLNNGYTPPWGFGQYLALAAGFGISSFICLNVVNIYDINRKKKIDSVVEDTEKELATLQKKINFQIIENSIIELTSERNEFESKLAKGWN